MKVVNWGIIGCGNVTEVKSGPAFNRVDNSRLVAVMRRDAEKARDYATRHNVPKWYSRAEDLINDPEINAVYIATPPNTHASYAIQVMKAGKPAYVEKPMALNPGECQEMIDTSKETGQLLFVAYYRRALPYFLKIKELIENGAIGQVMNFNLILHNPAKPEELTGMQNAGWRVNPSVSGGGHFHDLASHQIDYLDYLFGPVTEVFGESSNMAGLYTPEDNVTAIIKFKSGLLGMGSWCFAVPPDLKKDQAQIIGSKGRITFTFFGKPELIIESENPPQNLSIPHPPHIQQPLIDLIVKNILGTAISPSTGLTGIRAAIVMDKILRERKYL
jgi:predicted dehydrogenase